MNRREIPQQQAANPRLGSFRLFAYVLPGLPLAALGLPIVVHLPQYYASSEVGMNFAVTGLVFFIMRVFDVAIDPFMGYWSDRLRTRLGRRRPLVLMGAPILLLGIWMVFVPGGRVSVAHLCFWLSIMYIGWSMTVIPHLSWGSELTADYHERSRVYGWSMFATITGMIGVLVVPAVLQIFFHASLGTQVMSMAIFATVWLVPAIPLCVAAVPEPEVKLKTHAPLLPTLGFLLRNPAVRRVIAVDFLDSTNAGARGAMFLYFANFALGLKNYSSLILLLYFVVGCACIPLWIVLSRRIGKHRALIASYVYGFCFAPLVLLLPKGAFLPAAIVLGLSGASYGASSFLLRSMMADNADADTAQHGAERAGLMYSFLSLTSKLGLGLSVAIAFVFLSAMGFNPKAANAPAAIEHMRLFFIGFPVVLGILSLTTLLGYPLDEARQRRLRADVERLRESHISADDVLPAILPSGVAMASDSAAVAHLDSASANQRI